MFLAKVTEALRSVALSDIPVGGKEATPEKMKETSEVGKAMEEDKSVGGDCSPQVGGGEASKYFLQLGEREVTFSSATPRAARRTDGGGNASASIESTVRAHPGTRAPHPSIQNDPALSSRVKRARACAADSVTLVQIFQNK